MAFTEIDEKLLVRAYQAGDERAFDTIVRTQYKALFAHAVSRLRQHEAAEDAVQDTLLRAYRALPNLDGDLALKAWLHRILTNVCHDEGNRRRRQHGLVEKVGAFPEETAADPAEEAVLFDTVRIMSQALEDLPESYREALVLRYVDGLSFREVAEAAGVTEENARARVHRGRQALHKIMSRLAVMAAFVIPGLRKSHDVGPLGTEHTASSGAEPVHLVSQLTSHAMQAAPTMSRLAEFSSGLPGGKSTLAAAAITAVAAVSVPVAYTVNEARQPQRPPAAFAPPAPEATTPTEVPKTGGGPGNVSASSVTPPIPVAGPDDTVPPPTSTTETTLPASLTDPFEGSPEPNPTTSTTQAPPPSTVPPDEASSRVTGRIDATSVTVTGTGTGPQYDVTGAIRISGGSGDGSGDLAGRLFVYDDGKAEADELVITTGNGRHVLRFRGQITARSFDGSRTRYELSGIYHFDGADAYGLAERGDAAVVFEAGDDGSGVLNFELSGTTS